MYTSVFQSLHLSHCSCVCVCVLQEVTAALAVRERSPHYKLAYASNSCVCPSKTLLSHEKRSRYLSHAFSYALNSYVRKKAHSYAKEKSAKIKTLGESLYFLFFFKLHFTVCLLWMISSLIFCWARPVERSVPVL